MIELSNWQIFKILCRIASNTHLEECVNTLNQGKAWPQLLRLANRHNVVSSLASRLSAQPGSIKGIPESVLVELKTTHVDTIKRNMQIYAQALKIARVLNAAGIIPLFLKGTATLLTQRNRDIGFREQVDIDILIHPNLIKTASEAILESGYAFYPDTSDKYFDVLRAHRDINKALKESALHHHLSPLFKDGYRASIELHKHPLTKRFQHRVSSKSIFSTARTLEAANAKFQIPSIENQISIDLLGHFVHDGYAARFEFPLRTGCDYLNFLENRDSPNTKLNLHLLEQQCGRFFPLFDKLSDELLNQQLLDTEVDKIYPSIYLKLMQISLNSTAMENILHSQARVRHLFHMSIHNPRKLSNYLHRNIGF